MSYISTATTAYANTLSLTTQRTVSSRITADTSKQTTKSTDNASVPITDIVTISSQAKDTAKAVPLNNLSQFFAGRDDMPQPYTLSDEITNQPEVKNLTATGGQKPFAQVALDARASMDTQYAAMKATGKPFDINSWEGKDSNTLMGNLDRRSLYAVSSNQGGLFTKDEQQTAQIIMGQQESLALGLYSGPTSKAGAYVAPFASMSDNIKNGINFLDNVSPEEKSSVGWAAERASAQIVYENLAETEGKTPENLNSENPLAKLITTAMKTGQHNPKRGWTTGFLTTDDDLKRQTWFKGFETQLDQVMKQMQEKPTNTPTSGTLSTLAFDPATGTVAKVGSFSSATAGSATANEPGASLPLKLDAKK